MERDITIAERGIKAKTTTTITRLIINNCEQNSSTISIFLFFKLRAGTSREGRTLHTPTHTHKQVCQTAVPPSLPSQMHSQAAVDYVDDSHTSTERGRDETNCPFLLQNYAGRCMFFFFLHEFDKGKGKRGVLPFTSPSLLFRSLILAWVV
jgi:hypothetical protein